MSNLPAPLDVETLKAVEVFVPGGAMPIVQRIRDEVTKEVFDMTTKTGRERIASVAHKIAKSKTYLDKIGKELTEDWQKKTKAVNAERKIAWDALEALQKEVRKPLTDFEQAEEARVDRLKGMIEETASAGAFTLSSWMNLSLEAMQDRRGEILSQAKDTQWDEFEDWARVAHEDAVIKIDMAIQNRIKYEGEQAELAELRKLQAEQEQRDRDARVAAEAAAHAKAEAEAEARRAAEKAAREAQDAADKAAKEQRDAQEKIEAQERALRDAEAREQKAKDDAALAAAKAETDRLAAVERERQRQIDEEKAAEAKRLEREANKAHTAKINAAARNALQDVIDAPRAEGHSLAHALVEAIAEGRIPHTKINY